jgi:hypothetical protein
MVRIQVIGTLLFGSDQFQIPHTRSLGPLAQVRAFGMTPFKNHRPIIDSYEKNLRSPGDFAVKFAVATLHGKLAVCQARSFVRVRTGRFIRGLLARRIESMSIVVWKVIRRLPKPLLLVMLFFLMASVCRA